MAPHSVDNSELEETRKEPSHSLQEEDQVLGMPLHLGCTTLAATAWRTHSRFRHDPVLNDS